VAADVPFTTQPSGPDAAKPLRADARRNRARVLQAADAVFASKGPSASTEEVAERAGVAIGTVFRHFPTKQALLEAVIVDRLRRLADEAAALADADDPGAAFFAFFTHWAELAATKHALADALADAGVNVKAVESCHARVVGDLHRAVDALLTRAQRAGAVRDDIRLRELIALLIGASRAAEHAAQDPDLQTRTLAVVFDGLRPQRPIGECAATQG
jgi:AcrR family transcriptional regulator